MPAHFTHTGVRRLAIVGFAALLGGVGIAQQVQTVSTMAFLEGPTSDKEGNVYFVEMVTPRIMKVDKNGVTTTFRDKSNNANGLVIDAQGRLVACEGAASNRNGVQTPSNGRITRTDLATGKIEVLATAYQGKPLVGPNDLTLDGKGRIYFTDLGGSAA